MQFIDGVGYLVVGSIKTRRDTNTCTGAKVHKDLTADQFGRDFATIGHVENMVPPQTEESRGLRTVRPASSAMEMRRCVCRCDLARVAVTPISLTIS
jgi:hypothetical protein